MKVLIFLCQYKWSEVDNVGEEIQLTSQDEQFTTHVEGLMEVIGIMKMLNFLTNHHQHVIEKFPKSKTLGKI